LSRFGGGVLTTPSRGRSVDSSEISQILAQNRDFCLPHLHAFDAPRPIIAMPFGTEKLEWLGYPTLKKILKNNVYLF